MVSMWPWELDQWRSLRTLFAFPIPGSFDHFEFYAVGNDNRCCRPNSLPPPSLSSTDLLERNIPPRIRSFLTGPANNNNKPRNPKPLILIRSSENG